MGFKPKELAIVLEEAKQYTDSQQIAFTKKSKSLLLSADLTGIENEIEGETPLVSGDPYFAVIDKKTFNVVAKETDSDGLTIVYIGNLNVIGMGEDTGEPFLLYSMDGITVIICITTASHIDVYGITETVHQIDKKFIPPLDSLTINGADGKQYIVTVNESGALVATQKT